MTIEIDRLGHVLLVVREVERSLAFYVGVLGFDVLERDPEHGGVFLSAGDGSHILDVVAMPDAMTADAQAAARLPRYGVQHFAFRVPSEDSLRAANAELIGRGIPIRNTVDHVNQISVYVEDPDGNVVELYWERPDQRAIWARGRGDGDVPVSL